MRKATNPVLERRHFEILVDVLTDVRKDAARRGTLTEFDTGFYPAFARRLVDTNPNFQLDRFKAACETKWGIGTATA